MNNKFVDLKLALDLEDDPSVLIYMDNLEVEILDCFADSTCEVSVFSGRQEKLSKIKEYCLHLNCEKNNFLFPEDPQPGGEKFDLIIAADASRLNKAERLLKHKGKLCILSSKGSSLNSRINYLRLQRNKFTNVKLYWIYPNIYNYIWIMPILQPAAVSNFTGLVIKDYGAMKSFVIKMFLRLLANFGFLKWLVPSYLISAEK